MPIPPRSRLEALGRLLGPGFKKREDLLDYQSRQLARLVRAAAENVPYYQRLFAKAGIEVSQFRGLEDLPRLPVSSKDDLFSTPPEQLINRRFKPESLIQRRTSGSTGRPFTVRCTPFEERYLSALRFRIQMRAGARLSDKVVNVRYVSEQPRNGALLRILRSVGLFRLMVMNSTLDPADIARRLASLKPDIIRGYSNLTSLVADAATRSALEIRPRLVFVGGDNLTAGMRRRITDAFHTSVRETYASHELNLMALQCGESELLHVCEEGVILEVVRDGQPVGIGEQGEVIVTALHSFAQPFIRYRIGDIVTRGPDECPCGLPHSTIESIQGRIYDRIVLADGQAASPGDVLCHLEPMSWVRQYQMVQESRELVVLRLVVKGPAPPEDLTKIEQVMRRFLGPQVQGRIDIVDAIPLDRAGKFRASMSRVYSNYQEGVD